MLRGSEQRAEALKGTTVGARLEFCVTGRGTDTEVRELTVPGMGTSRQGMGQLEVFDFRSFFLSPEWVAAGTGRVPALSQRGK